MGASQCTMVDLSPDQGTEVTEHREQQVLEIQLPCGAIVSIDFKTRLGKGSYGAVTPGLMNRDKCRICVTVRQSSSNIFRSFGPPYDPTDLRFAATVGERTGVSGMIKASAEAREFYQPCRFCFSEKPGRVAVKVLNLCPKQHVFFMKRFDFLHLTCMQQDLARVQLTDLDSKNTCGNSDDKPNSSGRDAETGQGGTVTSNLYESRAQLCDEIERTPGTTIEDGTKTNEPRGDKESESRGVNHEASADADSGGLGKPTDNKENPCADRSNVFPGPLRNRSALSTTNSRCGCCRFLEFPRFNSLHVLQVFGTYVCNRQSQNIMIMEEFSGPTLKQYAQEKFKVTPPSEAELCRIVIPILKGLKAIHGAGFVHGDIKLENVMFRSSVTHPSTLAIVDLDGLTPIAAAASAAKSFNARAAAAPTAAIDVDSRGEDRVHSEPQIPTIPAAGAGAAAAAPAAAAGAGARPDLHSPSTLLHGTVAFDEFCFTPEYMPAEVLLEKRFTPYADLYAVGCITFILLEGIFPHPPVPEDELAEALHNRPKTLTFPRLKQNYSPHCQNFMKRLLEEGLHSRFKSADEALNHPWIAIALGKQTAEEQEEEKQQLFGAIREAQEAQAAAEAIEEKVAATEQEKSRTAAAAAAAASVAAAARERHEAALAAAAREGAIAAAAAAEAEQQQQQAAAAAAANTAAVEEQQKLQKRTADTVKAVATLAKCQAKLLRDANAAAEPNAAAMDAQTVDTQNTSAVPVSPHSSAFVEAAAKFVSERKAQDPTLNMLVDNMHGVCDFDENDGSESHSTDVDSGTPRENSETDVVCSEPESKHSAEVDASEPVNENCVLCDADECENNGGDAVRENSETNSECDDIASRNNEHVEVREDVVAPISINVNDIECGEDAENTKTEELEIGTTSENKNEEESTNMGVEENKDLIGCTSIRGTFVPEAKTYPKRYDRKNMRRNDSCPSFPATNIFERCDDIKNMHRNDSCPSLPATNIFERCDDISLTHEDLDLAVEPAAVPTTTSGAPAAAAAAGESSPAAAAVPTFKSAWKSFSKAAAAATKKVAKCTRRAAAALAASACSTRPVHGAVAQLSAPRAADKQPSAIITVAPEFKDQKVLFEFDDDYFSRFKGLKKKNPVQITYPNNDGNGGRQASLEIDYDMNYFDFYSENKSTNIQSETELECDSSNNNENVQSEDTNLNANVESVYIQIEREEGFDLDAYYFNYYIQTETAIITEGCVQTQEENQPNGSTSDTLNRNTSDIDQKEETENTTNTYVIDNTQNTIYGETVQVSNSQSWFDGFLTVIETLASPRPE